MFTPEHIRSRVAAWIAEAGPGRRTRKEIYTDFFGGNNKADEITAMLDQFVTTGCIVRTTRPRADGRPGRPTEIYVATHALNALTDLGPDQRQHRDPSTYPRT